MIATQTTCSPGETPEDASVWFGARLVREGSPNQTQTNETYQQLGIRTAVEVLQTDNGGE